MKTVKDILTGIGLIIAGLLFLFGWGLPSMEYDNAPYKDTIEATAVKVDVSKHSDEDRPEGYCYIYSITWELELNGEMTQIPGTEESLYENSWGVGDKKDIKIYSKDGKEYKAALMTDSKKSYLKALILSSVIIVIGVIWLAVTIAGIVREHRKK